MIKHRGRLKPLCPACWRDQAASIACGYVRILFAAGNETRDFFRDLKKAASHTK